MSAIGQAREITAKWYYKELWGWDLKKICEGPVREVFLKSLLVAANGDGALTDEERKWVIGRAAAAGAPDELIEALEQYPADEDMNDVVGRTLATDSSKRAVVYFAIKAATADGEYHGPERAAVRKSAKAMGISEDVVFALEVQCAQEEQLKKQRIALCFPEGNPFGL